MFNGDGFSVILGMGRSKNQQRVLRGGSWINKAHNLRSANRNHNHPDNRNNNTGLRLAAALITLFCVSNKAPGLINQLAALFRKTVFCGQTQGPQRVSRQPAQSLLPGCQPYTLSTRISDYFLLVGTINAT